MCHSNSIFWANEKKCNLKYLSAPRYNIEICRTSKNVYVQILGPFSMEMQTIENPAKNLMFQACEKVFVCTYNISIKILEYELRKFYLVIVAMVTNKNLFSLDTVPKKFQT